MSRTNSVCRPPNTARRTSRNNAILPIIYSEASLLWGGFAVFVRSTPSEDFRETRYLVKVTVLLVRGHIGSIGDGLLIFLGIIGLDNLDRVNAMGT